MKRAFRLERRDRDLWRAEGSFATQEAAERRFNILRRNSVWWTSYSRYDWRILNKETGEIVGVWAEEGV